MEVGKFIHPLILEGYIFFIQWQIKKDFGTIGFLSMKAMHMHVCNLFGNNSWRNLKANFFFLWINLFLIFRNSRLLYMELDWGVVYTVGVLEGISTCVWTFNSFGNKKVLEVFYVKATQREFTNAWLLLLTNLLCE